MRLNTLYKHNRRKVKEFMSREVSFVSLRCTKDVRSKSGWFWQAFQTGKDGKDMVVWDLGYKPFP